MRKGNKRGIPSLARINITPFFYRGLVSSSQRRHMTSRRLSLVYQFQLQCPLKLNFDTKPQKSNQNNQTCNRVPNPQHAHQNILPNSKTCKIHHKYKTLAFRRETECPGQNESYQSIKDLQNRNKTSRVQEHEHKKVLQCNPQEKPTATPNIHNF